MLKQDQQLKFLNYKEELQLRMTHYHEFADLISHFQKSYAINPIAFKTAALELGHNLWNAAGDFYNIRDITLTQIEDISRKMGTCGYFFFEQSDITTKQKFFKYMPLRYQPFLEELFNFAFHRELETLQFQIQDFMHNTNLDLTMINSIDVGELEVSLSIAEKVAQAVYMPAFELIRREYILFIVSHIRQYNPHREFHHLYHLNKSDKLAILQLIRYILQGDQQITQGEILFIQDIIVKLRIEDFNEQAYHQSLFINISKQDLTPLSTNMVEAVRRHILGLVIESAYSDRMLSMEEGPRILEIAEFILNPIHLKNSLET